ncbi:MAG TPA: hypothetical protein VLR94_10780 [Acidobacteriota bacterium]|nr:hypothetical protein [Acidobacteriota bacterium]
MALVYAWGLSWVAEDAYISFRYARNLVEGHGLVFNPGERVEGYTNFLWTLLLAAGLWIGGSPETISLVLGLVFTAGTFFAARAIHRSVFPGTAFPAALLALSLNYSWASFSTSGMETSLLTCLLVAGFALFFRSGARCTMASGAVLALAVMTRPDAVLAIAVLAGTCLLQRRMRDLLLLLAAFAILYTPYFLWRFSYYGDLLPNTFYAKSGALAYHKQGLLYAAQFLKRYNLWLLLPLPAVAAIAVRRRAEKLPDIALPVSAFLLIYSYYIIRIGGDFMEGRFFVPLLPFLYLLLEGSVRKLVSRPAWIAVGLAVVVLSAAADVGRLPDRTIVNGITDERTWQPVVRAWLLEGETLGRDLPADTIVATDAVGAFAWANRLILIDTLGLTDRTVAHLPVGQRSRPGHEKAAPLDYLRARGVAVLRDGVGIYRNDFPAPDFIFAGNRYYLLSSNPAIVQGFLKVKEELTGKQ